MRKRPFRAILVGTVLATAGNATFTEGTSAASTASFSQSRQRLEHQLASRVTALQRLTADVAASKTVTSTDATTLNARLSTETTSIGTLVKSVSNDTTMAQLRSARLTMYRTNRVFAIMEPQVVEALEADSLAAQVAIDQTNESSLFSSLSTLVGQPGYKTAETRYLAFAKEVLNAAAAASRVDTSVMAQIPANDPHDTRVFVSANHRLLDANIYLARAAYQETLIGLATGGYTRS